MMWAAFVYLLAFASLASASSRARNPLQFLATVEEPSINTRTHRVTALSTFDLEFNLYQGHRRMRLTLSPNHDILPDGAFVNHLDADGSVTRSEQINRLDHKIFKGTARQQRDDGTWVSVGWARISIFRDGLHPVFEGAFTVDHDNHHIQRRSSYMQTKHILDPEIGLTSDNPMVVWRDSDVTKSEVDVHDDLKRDVFADMSCRADDLTFNSRLDHPVYTGMRRRDSTHWGVMPLGALFGKRQIDSQPGGNGAGVDLVSTIGQTNGCPTTKKVALVGVAADCGYVSSFQGNQTAAQENAIHQMNLASEVWESTFSISLGLQNITIMNASCPGTPAPATPWNQNCESSLDIQDRLNLFSAWRGSLADQNSHWTLLTSCNTGSAVGLAWLGQACVHDSITSNTEQGNETVSGANVVARTPSEWQVIAHETGHTYGAVHDCTSDTCADRNIVSSQQCCPRSSTVCDAEQQYIMNPSTSDGISQFSPCTVGNICSAILRNSVNTTCLSANKGVVTISGQQCGNGIVEGDEQCDCGGSAGCGNNTCCDPTTCKFINNAICDDSNEECCRNCQFASQGVVCRASTGVCDPEEVCTGSDAICPPDATAPHGQACTLDGVTNAGKLECAAGQCTNRNLQCRTVMAGYVQGGNDTNACGSDSCSISCTSPAFSGTCYGLQQNFLDGTPCGGGGQCQNGACRGSSVKGWIDEHKGLVIGLAAGIGGLLLFIILSCIVSCCRRARRKRQFKAIAREPLPATAGGGWFASNAQTPAPPPPPHGSTMPPSGPPGWNSQSSQPQMQQQERAWQMAQQQSWDQGWRPQGAQSYNQAPASPVSQHSPISQGLYGNGILGNTGTDAMSYQGVPPTQQGYHGPAPPPHVHMSPNGRYA